MTKQLLAISAGYWEHELKREKEVILESLLDTKKTNANDWLFTFSMEKLSKELASDALKANELRNWQKWVNGKVPVFSQIKYARNVL